MSKWLHCTSGMSNFSDSFIVISCMIPRRSFRMPTTSASRDSSDRGLLSCHSLVSLFRGTCLNDFKQRTVIIDKRFLISLCDYPSKNKSQITDQCHFPFSKTLWHVGFHIKFWILIWHLIIPFVELITSFI